MTFDKRRFEREIAIWKNGHEPIRTEYNLNNQSVVFDLGAYRGEWSKKIVNKYNCMCYMFEILPQHQEHLRGEYTNQDNYKIFNFGLSNETKKIKTSLINNTDSFTIYSEENESKIEVSFKKMSDFLIENRIKKIDLLKINIEGGEYDLLEHMIEKDILNNITDIQIQFHWDYKIKDFYERRENIRTILNKTHKTTFDYYFVWENWRII